MKSFKQFLEQVGNIKQISYPAAVRHKIYNPLPKNPGGGGSGNSADGDGA